IASGVRCAEITRTSYGTWNSSRASAAARMVGQSESLPMMTPTNAPLACSTSATLALPQPPGGTAGARPYDLQVVAEHRDVADLATRPYLLPVQVHPSSWVGGEQVMQALVDPHTAGRSTEDVDHYRHRCQRCGIAQRVVEHRPQVLLEL